MARLPTTPSLPLPPLRPGDIFRTPRGCRLTRVYFAGRHAGTWHGFRTWGPAATARFDHHIPPPGSGVDRGVIYVGGDPRTAIVEAFQRTRAIHRTRDDPWLAVFSLRRPLRLLDLRGTWPTYAGASQALTAADSPDATQAWSRAIYDAYDIDGLLYPSAMRGKPKEARPPGIDEDLFCQNIALFERATRAMPTNPRVHIPLGHRGLDSDLALIAVEYRFDLL